MNKKEINFFAYGPLLFKEIWNSVVGIKEYNRILGYINGYSRYIIKNEVFPGIIKTNEYQVVYGLIYLNIDENVLNLLDNFKGKYYQREKVTVINNLSLELECWTYFFKHNYFKLLTDTEWDPLWFKENGIEKYKEYLETKKIAC